MSWLAWGGLVGIMVTSSLTSPAASETLRGSRGEVIGHLREEGSSIRRTDARYKTLGFYLRTHDITVDAYYKKIGTGNQLGRLLGR